MYLENFSVFKSFQKKYKRSQSRCRFMLKTQTAITVGERFSKLDLLKLKASGWDCSSMAQCLPRLFETWVSSPDYKKKLLKASVHKKKKKKMEKMRGHTLETSVYKICILDVGMKSLGCSVRVHLVVCPSAEVPSGQKSTNGSGSWVGEMMSLIRLASWPFLYLTQVEWNTPSCDPIEGPRASFGEGRHCRTRNYWGPVVGTIIGGKGWGEVTLSERGRERVWGERKGKAKEGEPNRKEVFLA